MSKISLSGTVAFNHVTKPDTVKGNTRYKITISLDKESAKAAEKAGIALSEWEGKKQVSATRKLEYGEPQVYNSDKQLVDVNHLSLYNDKVTILCAQGKDEWADRLYLDRIRVDEKAVDSEYDPSDF